MNTAPIRPGRIWYLLPVLLALAAFVIIPLATWKAVMAPDILAVHFKAPGGKDFEISRPGTYVLWHETETIFEGQTYSSPSNLPGGMQFELIDLNRTAPVSMTPDQGGTETIGSTVRRSVGDFDVTSPGKYRVAVNGQFPDQIFYFRESLWRQIRPVFHAVVLTLAGWMLAAGVAVIIFVRRRAARSGP